MSNRCSLILLLLVLVALCGCRGEPTRAVAASPTPSPSPAAARYRLVAVGDSLTEGLGVELDKTYPAQLERQLQLQGLDWAVVNAGVSGETSSGARSRLAWVLKLKPDAVILETGGNDGLRGVDPEVTKDNISAMIDELQKQGIPVMLCGMRTLTNMGEAYTSQFEALYAEIAGDKQVPFIPFFLEGVGGVPELNQDDRIHPTAEGYTEIVKRLTPIVAPWLKSLTP